MGWFLWWFPSASRGFRSWSVPHPGAGVPTATRQWSWLCTFGQNTKTFRYISLHSLLTSHCMTYQIFMYIIFACIYIYTSIIYHISASLRIPINPYLWAGGKGLHANSGLGRSLQYKDHLEIVFHNTAKPVKTKAITIVLYTCICMCIHIE